MTEVMNPKVDDISDIFTEEDFAAFADAAPVEGGGINRDYGLKIENVFFQKASKEYQAKVKKGDGEAIQVVFEGIDSESGEARSEKFSIGSGFALDGDGGETATKVKPVSTWSKFSASSMYGKVYFDLYHNWGITVPTEEGPGNVEDYTIQLRPNEKGEPQHIIIGPDGRRLIRHVKARFDRVARPEDVDNFVGLTLQMSGLERTINDKVQTYTFPTALLAVDTEGGEVKKTAPAAVKEVKAETPAAEAVSDDDLVSQFTGLAVNNDFQTFQKECMKILKSACANDDNRKKKWLMFVVAKTNYEDYKKGEGKAPQ
jgi:hypothetical protein